MVDAEAGARPVPRVHLRNGRHGYGVVTKALHWLTVLGILGQFVIGHAMDFDAGSDQQEERLEAETERLEGDAEDRGDASGDRVEADIERREDALDAEQGRRRRHRVLRRRLRAGLRGRAHPAGGPRVAGTARHRPRRRPDCSGDAPRPCRPGRSTSVVASAGWRGLEKLLLALLVVVPASGLLLVAAGEDWLPVHIAAQVAFLLAIAAHVGLVLEHTVVRRNRHLARML